jgi:hypothetical protein
VNHRIPQVIKNKYNSENYGRDFPNVDADSMSPGGPVPPPFLNCRVIAFCKSAAGLGRTKQAGFDRSPTSSASRMSFVTGALKIAFRSRIDNEMQLRCSQPCQKLTGSNWFLQVIKHFKTSFPTHQLCNRGVAFRVVGVFVGS